jgi:heme-degrading monooxygenase HmoA
MFARKVAARLKPNSLTEFMNLMECEILPWLRKQEGFLDLIILTAPDGEEVATLSFWDRPENEEAYNASGYPEVLKALGNLLDGTPYVKTFDVVSSTLHNIAGSGPTEADNLVTR